MKGLLEAADEGFWVEGITLMRWTGSATRRNSIVGQSFDKVFDDEIAVREGLKSELWCLGEH